MTEKDIPLLEFDPDPRGIIEPSDHFRPLGITEHCVMVFYKDVIAKLVVDGDAKEVYNVRGSTLDVPVYEIERGGKKLLVLCPPGGSSVSAAFMDIMCALGCSKFIACGSAGVLDRKIERGTVIIVDSAVRDEGTSHHYLPASREIAIPPETVNRIKTVINRREINYIAGKTWTTDAIYRETRGKIRTRREEGCVAVEMEASALIAVARHRNVSFGHILAADDDVSGDAWDPRREVRSPGFRQRLFDLAAEACLEL